MDTKTEKEHEIKEKEDSRREFLKVELMTMKI